ncbi:MAG: hemolysin family protein [Flavobacteriales bacterium]|jgi:putative hemolysin
MELLIIFLLVILNGVFSMAEMSLVSSRKFKLENARKKGQSGARTALDLAEHPTRFLSTVQIGITLIGILLGVYSGENITQDLALWLARFPSVAGWADSLAVGIVVVAITFFSILFGELLPKRIGMTYPEPIAIMLARPMKWIARLTSPFVWMLTFTNDILLKILGIRKTSESRVSEEEIKSIIKESAEGGEIQDIEQNIVERVFELGDRKVSSLCTHRSDLIYFDISDSWETISARINAEKHSAYPVCEEDDIDHVIGIVLLKDLFGSPTDESFSLRPIIREPLFLNENMYAYQVLELFRKEKMHYGIVLDEYGTTQGIITMDDVVDALVGDATEFDQDEYAMVQRDEHSWLVDGQYSVLEFFKYFDTSPNEGIQDQFATVAGLFIYLHNAIPKVGDQAVFEHLILEVVDKDGQRIDKILVRRIPGAEDE